MHERSKKYKDDEMCCGPCIGPNTPRIHRKKKVVSVDVEPTNIFGL